MINFSTIVRLLEIAGGGVASKNSKSDFVCPRDGHFGDKVGKILGLYTNSRPFNRIFFTFLPG